MKTCNKCFKILNTFQEEVSDYCCVCSFNINYTIDKEEDILKENKKISEQKRYLKRKERGDYARTIHTN